MQAIGKETSGEGLFKHQDIKVRRELGLKAKFEIIRVQTSLMVISTGWLNPISFSVPPTSPLGTRYRDLLPIKKAKQRLFGHLSMEPIWCQETYYGRWRKSRGSLKIYNVEFMDIQSSHLIPHGGRITLPEMYIGKEAFWFSVIDQVWYGLNSMQINMKWHVKDVMR